MIHVHPDLVLGLVDEIGLEEDPVSLLAHPQLLGELWRAGAETERILRLLINPFGPDCKTVFFYFQYFIIFFNKLSGLFFNFKT